MATALHDSERRTQEWEFYIPILRVLDEMGGRGRVQDILKRVEDLMADRLTKADRMPIKSGEERWRNTAKWARKHMIRERPPLLNPTSEFGWWEITDEGRNYLRANGSKNLR